MAGSLAIRDNGLRRAVLARVFAYRYAVSGRRQVLSVTVRTFVPFNRERSRSVPHKLYKYANTNKLEEMNNFKLFINSYNEQIITLCCKIPVS